MHILLIGAGAYALYQYLKGKAATAPPKSTVPASSALIATAPISPANATEQPDINAVPTPAYAMIPASPCRGCASKTPPLPGAPRPAVGAPGTPQPITIYTPAPLPSVIPTSVYAGNGLRYNVAGGKTGTL